MLLGAILIAIGFLARLRPQIARWFKIAGFVLFIGTPAAQIATGIYLAEKEMQAVAGE